MNQYMKLLSFVLGLLSFQCLRAQDHRSIQLLMDANRSTYFTTDPVIRKQVDSAFKMASAVLNSAEFQQAIGSMTFNGKSYCNGYTKTPAGTVDRIPGKMVLDSIFREPTVTMGFELKEKDGPLGLTAPGAYHTTAWYESIQDNMPAFHSFAYALAASLCHEYMHQVGFCHMYCVGGWLCPPHKRLNEKNGKPDPRFMTEDVTYKVGWTAYHILMNWKKEGMNPLTGK